MFGSATVDLQKLSKDKLPNPLPYDYFWPTVMEVLEKRTCQICRLYFASQKMKTEHKRIHKKNESSVSDESSEESSDESDYEKDEGQTQNAAPVIDLLGELSHFY